MKIDKKNQRIINYGQALKEAMDGAMKLDKKVLTFGLGVGKTSNVWKTTEGLIKKYGKKRVFDTPSSESAVTAMASGMSIDGLRPILIHQRFDFMLYSMDQIVNWISLWSYKSAGSSTMPLTIRTIVGKGWGQGPQHAKSMQSWFAHLPGLSVVNPSSAYEAKGLLLSSIFSNFPTIFIENRSLYSQEEHVPSENYFIKPTRANIKIVGKDITIVGFGSSTQHAMNVCDMLKIKNISAEVVDLRSLNPIDYNLILKSVKKTKNLAVIENGWPNASIASTIISEIVQKQMLKNPPLSFCWPNSHVPTSYKLEEKFYFTDERIFNAIKKIF